MMFKKVLFISLTGIFLFGFSSNVSAESDEDKIVDEDVVESVVKPLNNLLDNSTQSYTANSRTRTYEPLLSTKYAVSQSSATRTIDYIYVRSRTYNGTDGSLINSSTDSANSATFASARANNGTAYYGNDWALGNHTYRDSGYKTITHETRAEW